MDSDVLKLISQRVHEIRKRGEMSADQLQQESGVAPPGPPGPPPPPVDPATGQPMPPAPVDPATGQPMQVDPATGQPMPPAPAPEQPPAPTLEELLASGDPVVKLIVEMDQKLDSFTKQLQAVHSAIGEFMDNAGMTAPASKVMKAQAEAASQPAPAKTASAVFDPELEFQDPPMIDSQDPDTDMPPPPTLDGGLQLSEPPPTLKLGSTEPESLGSSGVATSGKPLMTGFVSASSRAREQASGLARHRG